MSWGGGRHSSNDRLPAPSGTEREGLDAKTVSTSNPSTPHSTRTHRTIVADPLKQFGVHLTMKDERVLKAAQNMPELAGAVVRYNISTQSAELPRRPYRDSWLVLSVLSSAILLIKYFYQFHPFQYEEGRWFSGGTLSSQWWGFDRIDRYDSHAHKRISAIGRAGCLHAGTVGGRGRLAVGMCAHATCSNSPGSSPLVVAARRRSMAISSAHQAASSFASSTIP